MLLNQVIHEELEFSRSVFGSLQNIVVNEEVFDHLQTLSVAVIDHMVPFLDLRFTDCTSDPELMRTAEQFILNSTLLASCLKLLGKTQVLDL